jgi:DNA invertase Pin-like site-specific DNA recombinase
MTKFVKAHYKGGHRVILGGVPCRVSYLPIAGGKALMAQSSREMCAALPPRNRKDRAKWERDQLAAYQAADKLGDRAIDEVVTPLRSSAPAPTVEPVETAEPVGAVIVPIKPVARPARPVAHPMRAAALDHPRARSITAICDTQSDTKGKGMIVGYARVSSVGQSLDIQMEALKAAGAEQIFCEKKSGTKATGREALADAIEFCRKGDVLLCTRLDRFARSQVDLHALVEKLTKKGVGFRCVSQPEMDTTTAMGKLLLGVLGAVAEFETDLRRERQREGIDKAKAAGVYGGRKKAIDDDRIRELHAAGKGPTEIAKTLGIHRMSVYRALEAATAA